MKVNIYPEIKSATQTSDTGTRWVLESTARRNNRDNLMGWRGSEGPSTVKIVFDDMERARAFARKQGYEFTVSGDAAPAKAIKIARPYAENFAPDRRAPWTH